jgi:hypothetical protein
VVTSPVGAAGSRRTKPAAAAGADQQQSGGSGGAPSASAAADDAAALLNRQAAAVGVPHAIMSSVTEVDGWCSVHSQADPHFVSECPRRWLPAAVLPSMLQHRLRGSLFLVFTAGVHGIFIP